ncbi:MAG: 3-dehydroquinate synthase [Thermodesulfovibrionales bacterium]
MQDVRVDLGDRGYQIRIGEGILKDLGPALRPFGFSSRIGLVSNPTVYDIYGETVRTSLRDAGFSVVEIIIPDGEAFKNLATVGTIYGKLLEAKLDRRSCLVALGGGVIGDITGFAASTYMRGIDFIQVPTTLLSQVDSSVGGKTGVNHPLGKNMIGTFWQPRLVWIDPGTLRTLPVRELRAGMSEVIKYGIIRDADFFGFLETRRNAVMSLDMDALSRIIGRSCEIKAEVVAGDEREGGLRAILNCGHTIGHAVETVTRYERYLHGEAVAIGMYLEARLASQTGFFDPGQLQRIGEMLDAYGLPSELPDGIDIDAMLGAMQIDKKTVRGALTFILPDRIGSVRIERGVPPDAVRKALQKP